MLPTAYNLLTSIKVGDDSQADDGDDEVCFDDIRGNLRAFKSNQNLQRKFLDFSKLRNFNA